jgi:cytochrome bd-type quinol oxidase subunit 2
MLIGVAALITWFMFGGALMMTWPILSVVTFLPLVGALFILLGARRRRGGARNIRWVALWTTLVTFAAVAASSGRASTPPIPGFQFVEKRATGSAAHQLPAWASTASRCCSSS